MVAATGLAPHPTSATEARASTVRLALAVTLLALTVRLAYLWEISTSSAFEVPFLDEERYWQLALLMVEGEPVGAGLHWQAPLYPWLLAGLMKVVGPSFAAIKVIQAIVGAITCGWTTLLATRIFDRRAGLWAGGLLSLYGPHIFYSGQILATVWASLAAVGCCWALESFRTQPGLKSAVTFGVACGLGTLLRPTFAVVAFAGLAYVVAREWRAGKLLASSSSAGALAFALTVAPVVAHKYEHTTQLSLTPVSSALNLYIGNAENRCELLAARGHRWQGLVAEPFSNDPRPRSQWRDHEASGYFREKAVEQLTTSPTSTALGVLAKFGQFWTGEEIPRNVSIYVQRKDSTIMSALTWRAGPFGFPFAPLFALAMVGATTAGWRRSASLWVFTGAHALAIALVFITARYRIPIVPLLTIYAGYAASSMWASLRTRAENGGTVLRTLSKPAIVGLLALVWTTLPFARCPETVNFEAEYQQIVGTYHLRAGRIDVARRHLQAALERDPNDAIAHENLGQLAAKAQSWADAAKHWRRALELDRETPELHQSLAAVLLRKGDPRAALPHFIEAIAAGLATVDDLAKTGTALMKSGQQKVAIEYLRASVVRATKLPDAYALVAHEQITSGDSQGAEATYRRAIEAVENPSMFRVALAERLVGRGEGREAQHILNEVLRANPGHQRALELRALISENGR